MDIKQRIPVTDANQNFSNIAQLVDEQGAAIILKNNKPRYAVIGIDEFIEFRKAKELHQKNLADMTEELMAENSAALTELTK